MKAIREAMEAYPERMEARIETSQKAMEAEITAGLKEVEVMDV
jgi:hypothetical protein